MFFALAVLVPSVSVLPMTFRLFADLGLLGTKYGIALVYATEQLPVSVFLLVTFMRAIPQELDEAALIDGCGLWDLFLRVVVPLSRNGIVTILILAFRRGVERLPDRAGAAAGSGEPDVVSCVGLCEG